MVGGATNYSHGADGTKIGNQYRKEWSMIWMDVIAGFLISGVAIVFVPQWVWNTVFLQGEGLVVSAENAIMGVGSP